MNSKKQTNGNVIDNNDDNGDQTLQMKGKLKQLLEACRKLQVDKNEVVEQSASDAAAAAAAADTAAETVARLEADLRDAHALVEQTRVDAERTERDLRLAAAENKDTAAAIQKLSAEHTAEVAQLRSELEAAAKVQVSLWISSICLPCRNIPCLRS